MASWLDVSRVARPEEEARRSTGRTRVDATNKTGTKQAWSLIHHQTDLRPRGSGFPGRFRQEESSPTELALT